MKRRCGYLRINEEIELGRAGLVVWAYSKGGSIFRPSGDQPRRTGCLYRQERNEAPRRYAMGKVFQTLRQKTLSV